MFFMHDTPSPKYFPLTRKHCYRVCLYIRVPLACGNIFMCIQLRMYVYLVYSNKNRKFCSGPAREHECDCKLGRELYHTYAKHEIRMQVLGTIRVS